MAGLPDRSTPSRALGLRAAGSAGLPLVRPKRADCASAFFESASDHLEGAPHEHKPRTTRLVVSRTSGPVAAFCSHGQHRNSGSDDTIIKRRPGCATAVKPSGIFYHLD